MLKESKTLPPLKIAVVTCCAPPETVVSGRVCFDLAHFLTAKGHKTTLISPLPSRPVGAFANERSFDHLLPNGLRHIRINSYTHPGPGVRGRAIESFSFGKHAVRALAKTAHRFDVVYCMAWPLLGQAYIAHFLHGTGTPFITNVQDIYPESLLNKSGPLTQIALTPLKLLDTAVAKKSTHVTVVSDSMKRFYIERRKLCPSKVTVVHNWQDEALFRLPLTKEDLWSKYGLEQYRGKKIFMYVGNIGPVAGLDHVLRGYSKLKRDDTALIIAGNGTEAGNLRRLSLRLSLRNTEILPISSELDCVPELQSLATACILPLAPLEGFTSMPSKLIAYMLSMKPILSSAEPGTYSFEVISQAKCGWIGSVKDGWEKLFATLLSTPTSELLTRGRLGHEFAMQNFSKVAGTQKIGSLLESLACNHTRT